MPGKSHSGVRRYSWPRESLPVRAPEVAALSTPAHPLDALFTEIEARKGADPGRSYTAKLIQAGPPKIAKKLGEEAVEAVIASLGDDKAHFVAECAKRNVLISPGNDYWLHGTDGANRFRVGLGALAPDEIASVVAAIESAAASAAIFSGDYSIL